MEEFIAEMEDWINEMEEILDEITIQLRDDFIDDILNENDED